MLLSVTFRFLGGRLSSLSSGLVSPLPSLRRSAKNWARMSMCCSGLAAPPRSRSPAGLPWLWWGEPLSSPDPGLGDRG